MYKVARLLSLGAFLLMAGCATCFAQSWPPWANDIFGKRIEYDRRWQAPDRTYRPLEQPRAPDGAGEVRDGGSRPDIAPATPPTVAFPYDFPVNSIVIDTGGRSLYYVISTNRAYQYPIAVGREGFNWTGTETISRKQAWPDWHPPVEMRERDPSLPEKMTGGVKNPLGAMALYLGNTLYRIHGTNDRKSIGQAQSSGCFRMLNSAIMHLASIAEIGTSVAVVNALPAGQHVSQVPEPRLAPAPQSAPTIPSAPPVMAERALSPNHSPDYRSLRDYTLGR